MTLTSLGTKFSCQQSDGPWETGRVAASSEPPVYLMRVGRGSGEQLARPSGDSEHLWHRSPSITRRAGPGGRWHDGAQCGPHTPRGHWRHIGMRTHSRQSMPSPLSKWAHLQIMLYWHLRMGRAQPGIIMWMQPISRGGLMMFALWTAFWPQWTKNETLPPLLLGEERGK